MTAGYKQFCPVAMAAEILCTRWTMVLVRELVAGSTRFNDLRRGVPRMSTALLSTRLKQLESAGIVEQIPSDKPRSQHEYRLTEAGRDLKSVVESIGVWGQRWVDTHLTLDNLDPSLLMWDMRRNLDPSPMPQARRVIAFLFDDRPVSERHWWLIVDPDDGVDLCSVDPGFEIDLQVSTQLRAMTSVWMGITTVKQEIDANHMQVDGDAQLTRHMQAWLGLSPFASEKNRLATS